MKTAAFQFVASPALASAHGQDDRLVAYDLLLVIAKALKLKREIKRLTKLVRALRAAEREQLKFAKLLNPEGSR